MNEEKEDLGSLVMILIIPAILLLLMVSEIAYFFVNNKIEDLKKVSYDAGYSYGMKMTLQNFSYYTNEPIIIEKANMFGEKNTDIKIETYKCK